ncbi:MAG TPA: methionine--tRNA ligase [Ktedonobacteraceae bacterium]|jgi:methionyl-tRNA synthetase|nr:methionine--tRNA ligase [Ktedonobacteraceae bacterium]
MTIEDGKSGASEGAPGHTRYYITTAIDYPNAPPHIGHALEKVIADVIARYHRLLGDDTYFSMGLDENSQHVLRAAQDNGADPHAWVAAMDEAFRLAWSKLDISYDYWIRTTTERHFRASQEMFRRAQEHGDIYRDTYSGWYCPNCNTFYTSDELVDGHCPLHPSITPEWLEEENYFFALSKYSERLLTHIETHPEFIVPAQRRAEVVGLIRQGLRDFSVSRQVRPGMETWGVPIPGDPQQVIYVWFDALTNYLTAVGFPDDASKFARYWPADAHVIGKDITRFHCLYWPAMLLSAGLPLPQQVAVHGFITLEGQRISKSSGNIIDPVALVDKVGTDAVRYYLMRNLSFASDGDFSRAGLVRHYNEELGNDLGNLLNRVVSMIRRYRGGAIPTPGPSGELEADLQRVAQETRQKAAAALESWDIGGALGITWNFVKRANQYIEQNEPWRLARQPEQSQRLDTVLYSAAEATRLLAILLAPYIPSSCDRIMQQLGLGPVEHGAWERETTWGSRPLTHVAPGGVLFPRVEVETVVEA